eukprot:768469-Hanusia_phi.AAC.5
MLSSRPSHLHLLLLISPVSTFIVFPAIVARATRPPRPAHGIDSWPSSPESQDQPSPPLRCTPPPCLGNDPPVRFCK